MVNFQISFSSAVEGHSIRCLMVPLGPQVIRTFHYNGHATIVGLRLSTYQKESLVVVRLSKRPWQWESLREQRKLLVQLRHL